MAAKEEESSQCPVCKSEESNTPGLKFKINTKCYHRICDSCVDRHYRDSGKKICPVFGCDKQLWKRDWRTQTFEDLRVEREVEIRKRVERILKRSEDEFESPRAYNDYLELRETVAMNLVFKTDAAATDRKLKEYQLANNILVDKNLDIKVKASWRKAREAGEADPSGLIQGLKKFVAPPPVVEYDAFEGLKTSHNYFDVKADYLDILHPTKPSRGWAAGGYSFVDNVEESLMNAFAGLGVFLEDEKAQGTAPTLPNLHAPIATKAVDDVF